MTTSNEDLRLIHLARLPEVVLNTGRLHPTLIRALLTAIVIETDNGRQPARMIDIVRAASMGSKNSSHASRAIDALVQAGLVRVNCERHRPGIGMPEARSISVVFEQLAKVARRPLTADACVMDPLGIADLPAPQALFELRDRVLSELGVGVEYIRALTRQTARDTNRLRTRAAALHAIRRRWRARTAYRLTDVDLAALVGINRNMVRAVLAQYPEPKPQPKAAAA